MDFVILKSFNNYIDAHLLLSRLKDEGVNCWLKNENTNTIMPIWSNAIGGVQVMVHRNNFEKASYILKAIDEERRSKIACPQCHSKNVEYINTIRKPVNWLSAIVTFFSGDYAVMPEQRYHCFDCGKEWKLEEAM